MTERTMDELAAAMYSAPASVVQPATQAEPEALRPRTEQELGEALYGRPKALQTQREDAEVESQTAPATARSPEEIADALYGNDDSEAISAVLAAEIPDEIKAERAADPYRQMYSAQATYKNSIPESLLDNDPEIANTPAAVKRAALAEVREIAADLHLTNDDLGLFKTVRAMVTETPPDDTQRAEWRDKAIQALNAEFGYGAAKVYRDAVALVKRDPRVLQSLNENGFGDHSDVIMAFARAAQRKSKQSR